MATGVTAEAMRQRLTELLAPSWLEVIDESIAHAGHAGSDGTGSGTHFRVRIAAPGFAGAGGQQEQERQGPGTSHRSDATTQP